MNKAVDNAFLNFTSNISVMVVTSAISLWLTPYLIGKLGVEVYGVVPLFTSSMVYLSLVTAVLSSAVSRYVSLSYYRGDNQRAIVYLASSFWGLLGLSAVILVLTLVFSAFLDKVFSIPAGYEIQTRWLFVAVVVSSLLAAINSTYTVSLFILHKFYWMDIVGLISRAVQIAVIVLGFTYVSTSLTVVGFGSAASSLCGLLLMMVLDYYLIPELRINYRRFDMKACREMADMGIGVIVNQFGALLYLNSDLIIINILLGSTATGQYGPIVQWVVLIRTIAAVVMRQFDPVVMELIAKEDYDTLKTSLFRLAKLLGLILGLPICLICGFSKPLLLLWLGPDFVGLYKLMILLILGQIVPYSLGNIFSIFRGLNTLKIPGYVTIVAGVFNIVVAVILIKYTSLGLYGAGVATIIAVFGKGVLFNVIYLSRLLKFNPWKVWDSLAVGCAPAVIFTAGVFIASKYIVVDHVWKLCAYGAIAGIVYCLAVFRLFMNEGDRRFTMRVLKVDKLVSEELVDILAR
jgi:O-antigen/teichoic acid export membrane protein